MALSDDIKTQFAKLAVPEKKDEGATLNGTYKIINGKEYVQLDGSDILTPVKSTVEAETGEKVKVLIKDHAATITGNITSPSARGKDVRLLKDEVDEQGNSIRQMDNSITQQGNSIIQIDNRINEQNNSINRHDSIINQHGDTISSMNNTIIAQGNAIDASNNTIVAQGNIIDSMNNTITQHGDNIISINNTISAQGNTINQQGNVINQQGNTINEQNSQITILNSAFVIDDGVITGLTGAIIDNIKTDYLDAAYADIDFTNINIAAISTLFSESGIIKDLVVQQGSITGELVGVTIKGDLIEANSLKADKLVVRGEDGLYYKLNIDGMNNISTQEAAKFVVTSEEPSDWETNYKDYYIVVNNEYVHLTNQTAPTWQANTYYKLKPIYQSGLDGTNIVANSITADKIQVTDLVAFGATIGGFVIGNASIHTPTKTSIDSDLNGIYLGQDGQIYIGDINNRIKYYKDSNDQWKLDIKADEIRIGSSNKTIQQEIDEVREDSTIAYNNANTALNTVNNLQIGNRNLFRAVNTKNYNYGLKTTAAGVTYDSQTGIFNYTGENQGGLALDGKYYVPLDGITELTYQNKVIEVDPSNASSRMIFKFFDENKDPIIGTSDQGHWVWNQYYKGWYTDYAPPQTMTIPSGAKYVKFSLSSGIPDSTRKLWVTITSGNKASDWIPAPEDVNEAINQTDKFVISDTQPGTSDQDKLWYDTTTQKIKKWIPANPDDPSSIPKWIVVNDYSGEISAVLEVANTAASAAGQIDQKISEANTNLSSEITGQYEAYVSSEIAKYDEDVQINIIKQIKANDTIANVVSNFSFEEDGLYIGKSNSQYKLQAANDRINMLYYDENNNKQIISYWNRDVFNSSKIETNEFSIPPFKWFLRSNGSLSLRKE